MALSRAQLVSRFGGLPERRFSSRVERGTGADYASVVYPLTLSGIVEVKNESAGGIAILVDEVGDLEIDDDVELVYEGATLRTIVRAITAGECGQWVIGLQHN